MTTGLAPSSDLPPGTGGTFVVPASYGQTRLWFVERLSPGGAYNVPAGFRITGPLDSARLERALNMVVERHESLRTTFALEGDGPVQVVHDSLPVRLAVVDLSALPHPEAEAESRRRAERDAETAFDLERGPLVRATLLRLGAEEHHLFLTLHHIVVDAWSWGIFLQEIGECYAALTARRPPNLPALPIQYPDYAVWQQEWLKSDEVKGMCRWWSERLGGELTPLDLPYDHPRPYSAAQPGARLSFAVPAEAAAQLSALARRHEATPFIAFLAAYAVFLSRHTRQHDLVIGTPITDRTRSETLGLIGFFLNMLAIRVDLGGAPSFRQLLDRVRTDVLDAFQHQDVPFERLVEELKPPRQLGRHPIFQTVFVYQVERGETFQPGGIVVDRMGTGTKTSAKFDLSLFLSERSGRIAASFEYRADLFDGATIGRMAGRFAALLESIARHPDTPVDQLDILPAAEREQVVTGWNQTATKYPRDATIGALFREQAVRTPNATALRCGSARLTYAELDDRSARLAAEIRRRGFGPGRRIGFSLQRSPELVVALLGILRAGCAYVPLDPIYPDARIEGMVEDAEVGLVLVHDLTAARFGPGSQLGRALAGRIVDITHRSIAEPEGNDPAIGPESEAYVVFTSGSTGRPKGVVVPHRAVIRLVRETNYVTLGPSDRVLGYAPISFDASTFEVWGALLNGGELVLVPAGRPSIAELGGLIERERITVAWLTAALFHQMVEVALPKLRGVHHLLAGGDVLSPPHVEKFRRELPNVRLTNGYGPTENTTFTCCHPIGEIEPGGSVPIGKPIANTTVYLLDERLAPVPIGVVGELYAGGDGLALGYAGHPDLTAERFIPDPFGPAGGRLYRTGDLARHRGDGTIEFLGRGDTQVKIRGFRIEPAEVEAALARMPGVRLAAVVVREDPQIGRFLAGFIEPTPGAVLDPAGVRLALGSVLPPYMIPAVLDILPALPLTTSGKVDRRQLPEVSLGSGSGRADSALDDLAPRTVFESELGRIWEKILGVPKVRPTDDFFAIGGHSLLAARMIDEIADHTGVSLPLATLYQASTVRALAMEVERGAPAPGFTPMITVRKEGSRRPFFMVHGDVTGGGFFCRGIAAALGPDVPVYAFPPRDLAHDDRFVDIQSMARFNLELVRRIQPEGPYRLGGYCLSGLVAHEMARMLTAEGQQVEALILVDAAGRYSTTPWLTAVASVMARLSHPVGNAYLRRRSYLLARLRHIQSLPPGERWVTLLAYPRRWLARRLGRRAARPRPPGIQAPRRPFDAEREAVVRYQALCGALFRARPAAVDAILVLSNELAAREERLLETWRGLCRKIETLHCDATHFGVVATHLPGIVKAELDRLDRAPEA